VVTTASAAAGPELAGKLPDLVGRDFVDEQSIAHQGAEGGEAVGGLKDLPEGVDPARQISPELVGRSPPGVSEK
jgi:hypothetical protein